MAITVSDRFAALAPEYNNSSAKAVYLQMADERLVAVASGVGFSQAKRDQAVALLAAHIASLSLDVARAGGSGGEITSKREGSLSVGFSSGGSGSDVFSDFKQTKYGRQLIGLIRGTFVMAGVITDEAHDV